MVERGDDWVCLRAIFDRDEASLGFVTFRRGDTFVEWFYRDRWYNVFQVYEGDTPRLKGWYCNITRPPVITEDTVTADDLALDVFVMPNGTILLLDEREFSALNLPTEERIAALRAIEALRKRVAGREPPFQDVRPDAV
jgi:predicted RNA-binding protein associated with RNAse of E/G family